MSSKGLLSRRGRITVLTYNARIFLLTLTCVFVIVIMSLLFGGGATAVSAVVAVTLTVAAPAYLSAVITRLHDLDLVGWWGLILLIPFAGWLFQLYIALTPGEGGRNRFGDARSARPREHLVGVVGIVFQFVAFVAVVWQSVETMQALNMPIA